MPKPIAPYVFLSVRDVFLLRAKLEHYKRQLDTLKGRVFTQEKRHVEKLLAKLEEVKWT